MGSVSNQAKFHVINQLSLLISLSQTTFERYLKDSAIYRPILLKTASIETLLCQQIINMAYMHIVFSTIVALISQAIITT